MNYKLEEEDEVSDLNDDDKTDNFEHNPHDKSTFTAFDNFLFLMSNAS